MSFFRANGRLRRRSYFLRQPLLLAIGIASYSLPMLFENYVTNTLWLKWAAFAGIALVYYLLFVQMIKRLHDLDLKGWWVLVGLLPVVNYVLGAGLQFVQGTIGPNRWGLDPKRPHLLPPLPPVPDDTDNSLPDEILPEVA